MIVMFDWQNNWNVTEAVYYIIWVDYRVWIINWSVSQIFEDISLIESLPKGRDSSFIKSVNSFLLSLIKSSKFF